MMTMSVLKTLVFTVLAPGTVTVVIPRHLLGVGAQAAVPFGLRVSWESKTEISV